MKRYNIITCKDFTLSCEINIKNRFNKEVSLFIFYNNKGYLKSIPFTDLLCKFLKGYVDLSEVIIKSKSILYNNINKEVNELPDSLIRIIDININQIYDNSNKANILLILKLIDDDSYKRKRVQDFHQLEPDPKQVIEDKIFYVLNAISTLDILRLHPLLKEDMTYMRMNVYQFLNYMNKKYDEFKKHGDTYLKYDKLFFNSHVNNHVAEDLGLKKDFEGLIIIFYGNNSDKELSFLLRTKNSKIVSIDIVPTKKIKKNINSKK